MKTPLRLVFWLCTGSITSLGYGGTVTASSRIASATVYPDRAVVTRSAHVELPAGDGEILLEKLPVNLLDASLQVSGSGVAGVTILDVTSRPQFVAATPDPRIKNLEDQLNAETKKLRTLTDRAAIIDQQRSLIARIENAVASVPGKDSPAVRPSFDEWQKLVTFAEDNRNRYAVEQQTLDQQRQDQQAKIDALNAQLNELRGHTAEGRGYKSVAVHVSATQAGAMDLNVAYTVLGASWAPAYDARLRAEDRSVDLSYFGVVRQNTGEDWKDITLTLSTARPSLGGGAPELLPWILDVVRPVPMETAVVSAPMMFKRERLALGASATSSVAEDKAMSEPPAEAGMATATVSEAATSASFKVVTPTTVQSDNTPQKVGIGQVKLAASLEYRAAPRLAETAFLSAEVTNTSDYPLLAGTLNTFLGDSYIATGALKTVMPMEKFSLSLGADEGISIKRKLVNRFSEDTGLTNRGRRVTYEYLFTVINNKRTAERVVFRDTLPISRYEKIVVNLLMPSDREIGTTDKPKEVIREADGKLAWRLDLKAGEKREIRLKFNVEHPADVPVSGLD